MLKNELKRINKELTDLLDEYKNGNFHMYTFAATVETVFYFSDYYEDILRIKHYYSEILMPASDIGGIWSFRINKDLNKNQVLDKLISGIENIPN